MNTNHQRIQELAHQLWESEGKPHDRAAHHWDEACKLIATEERAEQQMGATEFSGLAEAPQQEASLEKKTRKRKVAASDEVSSTTPVKPKKATAKKSKAVATEHE